MIRTVDTYNSVSRTAKAVIVFDNDTPGDSRPYRVTATRDGVNYGDRWFGTEEKAREAANDFIEQPDCNHWVAE